MPRKSSKSRDPEWVPNRRRKTKKNRKRLLRSSVSVRDLLGSGKRGQKNQVHFDQYVRDQSDGKFYGKKQRKIDEKAEKEYEKERKLEKKGLINYDFDFVVPDSVII